MDKLINTPDSNKRSELLHLLYSGQGGLGAYFINFVESDRAQCFRHHAIFYGIEPLYPEYTSYCEAHSISFEYIEKKQKIDLEAFRAVNNYCEHQKIECVLVHTASLSPFYFFLYARKFKVVFFDHTSAAFKTKIEWILTMINHLLSDVAVYFYPEQFRLLQKRCFFLHKGKHTLILPKQVDTTVFKPKSVKPNNVVFTLGISSRIIAGKRHDLLIEAVRILKKKGILVKLRIAGAGPLLGELIEKVKSLEIDDEIDFVGLISREKMVLFYHSLDAYIHATNSETICYSILEAQACGLPIIASHVDGIKDVIQNEINGLLFQNDKEAIAGAIERVMYDTSIVEKLKNQSLYSSAVNKQHKNPAETLNIFLKNL